MKKKIWMLFTIFAVIVLCTAVYQYEKDGSARMAEKLGAGINIGNSLDCIHVTGSFVASVEIYETYRNNPPIRASLFRSLKKNGFDTVRIPVSWGEHMTKDWIVDSLWMDRVEEVVRQALANDLYVILDTHHEEWLVPTEDAEAESRQKLCTLWEQIAERFAGYDERLLFEGMNAPGTAGSSKEWTGGGLEEREVVNRLNAAFVETVRSCSGHNKERFLILTTYGSSNSQEALDAVELPQDNRLLLAVHGFVPGNFCQEVSGTAIWDERQQKTVIADMMRRLKDFSNRNKVAVLVTAFGCLDKDNPAERLKWASYYIGQAKENGIPCFWWDDGSGYRLIERGDNSLVEPDLTKLLVS